MVTTLSKLVEMIDRGAIPAWLRDYVEANREAIERDLREKGSYTFRGPEGIEINVETEKKAVAA